MDGCRRDTILCIDEVGYLSYDSNAADLLYEIVNRRYERSSILITTNRLCTAVHKRFRTKPLRCDTKSHTYL